MFGGGLPVPHLGRNRLSQKEWATVLTNFSDRCIEEVIHMFNWERIHEWTKDTRKNRGDRIEVDIHENRHCKYFIIFI